MPDINDITTDVIYDIIHDIFYVVFFSQAGLCVFGRTIPIQE